MQSLLPYGYSHKKNEKAESSRQSARYLWVIPLLLASSHSDISLEIVRSFSEENCLRQLKLDDERVFDALFRHYSALVYRFAYSYLKSRVEAEEIVQDCFLKIWEKR